MGAENFIQQRKENILKMVCNLINKLFHSAQPLSEGSQFVLYPAPTRTMWYSVLCHQRALVYKCFLSNTNNPDMVVDI